MAALAVQQVVAVTPEDFVVPAMSVYIVVAFMTPDLIVDVQAFDVIVRLSTEGVFGVQKEGKSILE